MASSAAIVTEATRLHRQDIGKLSAKMGKKGFAGHKERKRGKKKSKQQDAATAAAPSNATGHARAAPQDADAGLAGDEEGDEAQQPEQPSWILDSNPGASERRGHGPPLEEIAPFGFVDADIKAYFRDVHQQLQELEYTLVSHHPSSHSHSDEGDEAIPQHTQLLRAVIRETDGKELVLSTDPDTSIIVEYIASFMSAKQVRVLLDRFSGASLLLLAKHRYGSHVLQTALSALQSMIAGEVLRAGAGGSKGRAGAEGSSSRDKLDDAEELSGGGEQGVLRSGTTLLLDAVAELQPSLPLLLQDAFGTHLVRVLLLLLTGTPISSSNEDSQQQQQQQDAERSKKSAAFRSAKTPSASAAAKGKVRARDITTDQASSLLLQPDGSGRYRVPSSFGAALREVQDSCLGPQATGINELRALAISHISAPTLAVFLRTAAVSTPPPSAAAAAPVPAPAEGDKGSKKKRKRAEESAPGAGSAREPDTSSASYRLHDLLLDGLVAASCQAQLQSAAAAADDEEEAPAAPARSDFIETMLRDAVGSHVLQACVATLPPCALRLFARVYCLGRAVQLGLHPIAHFVLNECVRRLGAHALLPLDGKGEGEGEGGAQLLAQVIEEVQGGGSKLVREGKVSLLQATLEAASSSASAEGAAVEALLRSFLLLPEKSEENEPESEEERKQRERDLIPVVLALKTRKEWRKEAQKKEAASAAKSDKSSSSGGKKKGGKGKHKPKDAFATEDSSDESDASDAEEETQAPANGEAANGKAGEAKGDQLQAKTAGSVLLQHLARLSAPANAALHASLAAQPDEVLLRLCRSPVAVHAVLAALNSASTTFAQRRALFERLLPLLHVLADDRWGSRVSDALWERADPFTRVSRVDDAATARLGQEHVADPQNSFFRRVFFFCRRSSSRRPSRRRRRCSPRSSGASCSRR